MAVSPNPVFKFSGQMFTVKVQNIPPISTIVGMTSCSRTKLNALAATRQDILQLFTTLIGTFTDLQTAELCLFVT